LKWMKKVEDFRSRWSSSTSSRNPSSSSSTECPRQAHHLGQRGTP
jgi:hypothetical protein